MLIYVLTQKITLALKMSASVFQTFKKLILSQLNYVANITK